MKATSKQEFFELLGYELNRLGIEDTTEIFADFEEHFSDGFISGIPENEIAENLGDIKEIARSYLNLESSRLNSIMARDVERTKISLTKPGRSVPADLSLVKEDNANSGDIQDILNSDNIRSYTPEHISGEIFPEAPTSTPAQGTEGESSSQESESASTASADNNSQSAGSGTTANQTVAGAFSEAGRAAVDAAKIAGHAIADAFAASNVKTAVTEAGKSAAEAVKTAGKSAADAINKAKAEHEQRHANAQARHAQNTASDGEIYPDAENTATGEGVDLTKSSEKTKENKKDKKDKPFSRISDFKGMKADVNTSKLVTAILLDCFLWSWLLPMIAGLLISVFCIGGQLIFENGFGALFDYHYYLISRFFLFMGFVSLGGIVVVINIWLVKAFFRLVRYVIVLHYRAIYNV